MKKKKKSLTSHQTLHFVAATVFALVTFVHALRLAFGWPLVIGNWAAPPLLSWVAVFLTGSLSVLMWHNACN